MGAAGVNAGIAQEGGDCSPIPGPAWSCWLCNWGMGTVRAVSAVLCKDQTASPLESLGPLAWPVLAVLAWRDVGTRHVSARWERWGPR